MSVYSCIVPCIYWQAYIGISPTPRDVFCVIYEPLAAQRTILVVSSVVVSSCLLLLVVIVIVVCIRRRRRQRRTRIGEPSTADEGGQVTVSSELHRSGAAHSVTSTHGGISNLRVSFHRPRMDDDDYVDDDEQSVIHECN